jgi:hypothetical protein
MPLRGICSLSIQKTTYEIGNFLIMLLHSELPGLRAMQSDWVFVVQSYCPLDIRMAIPEASSAVICDTVYDYSLANLRIMSNCTAAPKGS